VQLKANSVDGQYFALYRLWEVFLHMRAWGRPAYESLGQESRDEFARLVAAGLLFEYVEDCKIELVALGVAVPDAWLGPLCAARILPDAPLPDSDEAELGRILTNIYPSLLRLSAAMSAATVSTTDQPPRPPAEMPEAVSRAGASLEWVRNERPDLMPPDGTDERYTRAQYDYLRENGCPAYDVDARGNPMVPAWDTWARYVRDYLRRTLGRVNSPRAGRTGRSIVRSRDVEARHRDN
jgi:hypothetical protein